MDELIANKTMWATVINDLSSSKENVIAKEGLNFHEFVVLRSVAVAWSLSAG